MLGLRMVGELAFKLPGFYYSQFQPIFYVGYLRGTCNIASFTFTADLEEVSICGLIVVRVTFETGDFKDACQYSDFIYLGLM